MFCPVCKAEYRAGFAKCSDCGVDLVEELPPQSLPESYSRLWTGEDAIFRDSLVLRLEEAGIEYVDTPLHVYARYNLNFVEPGFGPHFGFVISVPSTDLPAARVILEKLLDVEPQELAGEVNIRPPEESQVEVTEFPANWDPATATFELVSGKPEEQAAFLEDALRGVGIPTRREILDDGALRILVRPEDEGRARSVRAQIEEQSSPPESEPEPQHSAWDEQPVRSYALLYYLLFPYALAAILVLAGSGSARGTNDFILLLRTLLMLVSAIGEIGFYWMLYQAVRYEIRPLKFVLLAFLPLSFVWYYFERYATRRDLNRVPIAARVRMYPPQT